MLKLGENASIDQENEKAIFILDILLVSSLVASGDDINVIGMN